tara:strand:- start:492 stop:956 length:465 start_codon:yes stop_codon:yes gene_type:complete
MKVLFYSKKCDFCSKIIKLLKNSGFYKSFNLVCLEKIDISTLPDYIKSVPTLIVEEVDTPLVGKAAFDYLDLKKYFNNPTNNIHNWQNKSIPKPDIVEDKKASDNMSSNFGDLNDVSKGIKKETKKYSKNNLLLNQLIQKRNQFDKDMGFKRKK